MVNPVFAKLLGKKREDFTSKSGSKKLLNRLSVAYFEKFVQMVETREAVEQEFCYETNMGKKCYDLIAIKLGDGFSITVRDITEIKRLENLHSNDEILHLLRCFGSAVRFVEKIPERDKSQSSIKDDSNYNAQKVEV